MTPALLQFMGFGGFAVAIMFFCAAHDMPPKLRWARRVMLVLWFCVTVLSALILRQAWVLPT